MLKIDGKDVPETLAELLVPATTAHVIIDLQNDCCHPDGSLARAGSNVSMYSETIDVVARFINDTRECGVLQVFVQLLTLPDSRSDSPAWLRLRQRLSRQYGGDRSTPFSPVAYCIEGTWGAELIKPLAVTDRDIVVYKHRSSSFFGTDLDLVLRSNGIETVVFTGCTTEGCVESTVRDAGSLDYFPVVARDGVQSDVPDLHQASLRVMEAYRADVATTEEIVAALRSHARPQA